MAILSVTSGPDLHCDCLNDRLDHVQHPFDLPSHLATHSMCSHTAKVALVRHCTLKRDRLPSTGRQEGDEHHPWHPTKLKFVIGIGTP